MTAQGKVRVLVRSRRVPVGTAVYERPTFTGNGVWAGSEQRRVILYEDRFDPSQQEAIEKGKELSCSLGLGLEVVDLGTMSLIKRAALRLLHGDGPYTMVHPGAVGPAGEVTRHAPALEQSVNPN